MHFRRLVCPLPMWEAVLGVGDCAPDAGLAISLFGSALLTSYVQLCAPYGGGDGSEDIYPSLVDKTLVALIISMSKNTAKAR